MKKIEYVFCACIVAVLGACNRFLDVNPAGTLTQDRLFEDIQGYRDAMYGVYASIAKEDLYGKNLTYGFADQLAQLFYNPYEAPHGITTQTLNYAYRDPNVFALIETVWAKAYEAISYLNNILENIAREDMGADPDYPLIRGEAYALRAFLHFDIMRYYCDNFRKNPSAGGIPYAYSFDIKNKKLYSLRESYANVLDDLSRAQQLLAGDTLLHLVSEGSLYRRERYSHMNLYAVYAIKSRVFQAKGELDSAGIYAEKIIRSGAFKLVEHPARNLNSVKKYPGGDELIWGLFSDKLYAPLFKLFLSDGRAGFKQVKPRLGVKRIYQDVVWNSDNHDYRWEEFFGRNEDGMIFIRLLRVNPKDPVDVQAQKKATRGISMLRLPEVYYIAAEALYNKDKAKALDYFNRVRRSRGLNAAMEEDRVDTYDKFMKELLSERRKELWGEGQIFMDYKRMHTAFWDITSRKKIEPSPDIFILPWPRNEVEFGNTHH